MKNIIAFILSMVLIGVTQATTLTWDYPPNVAEGFRIVCNDSTIWSGPDQLVSIDGLISDGVNSCRVYAYQGAIDSGPSNEVRFLHPSPSTLQVTF